MNFLKKYFSSGIKIVKFAKKIENKEIINIFPNRNEILKAIQKINGKRFKPKSYFYPVKSCSAEFYKILLKDEIWKINLQKQFKDIKI